MLQSRVPPFTNRRTNGRRQAAEHAGDYSSIRAVFVDGTPGPHKCLWPITGVAAT